MPLSGGGFVRCRRIWWFAEPDRFVERIGVLSDDVMLQIDAMLRAALDL